MMKRIARAVRQIRPTDAIAMLKETLRASGMERIISHVMLIGVSKLVVVRVRLNDVTYYVLDARRKQKTKQSLKIYALRQNSFIQTRSKFSKDRHRFWGNFYKGRFFVWIKQNNEV